jgi:hypothetical protein
MLPPSKRFELFECTVTSSETLVAIYQTTRRYISEDHSLIVHFHENLISYCIVHIRELTFNTRILTGNEAFCLHCGSCILIKKADTNYLGTRGSVVG